MAGQHGHSIDNVVVRDHAYAHFGDNITYRCQDGPPTKSNIPNLLLTSLSFDHMNERSRNVAIPLPSTSEWLPRHPTFLTWASSTSNQNSFLWVKGKPGSGKSTIMKETLDWIKYSWSDHLVLFYFFNARSPHLLEKSSLGLYRSLLWQFLPAVAGAQAILTDQFASKVKNNQVEPWTEIELQNFLILAVRKMLIPPIVILIDALDEGAEDDIRRMVRYLTRLTQYGTAAGHRLRICLSSRHYPHISIANSLSITVEDQAEHSRDIDLYIRSELVEEATIKMKEVQRQVSERSAGTFLWVVLVVPMLNQAFDEGKSEAAMLRELQKIPQDLHDLFTQIFLRDTGNTEGIHACINLLRWVLFAMKPLSPIELYCAVRDPGSEATEVTSSEAVRYVRSCSRGLVELTKGLFPNIQFIHESVRNYLTAETVPEANAVQEPGLGDPGKLSRRDLCHEKLAEACLRYVLHSRCGTLSVQEVQRQRPFIRYAARYWWQHFYLSPKPCNATTVKLALELLTGSTEQLQSWVKLSDIQLSYDVEPLPRGAAPLYYAARIGRAELVSGLLDLGVDVEVENGHDLLGTPLHVAASENHQSVVQVLVQAGADLNGRSAIRNFTALQEASRFGNEEVVQTLIAAGAEVNVIGGMTTSNALQEASDMGHEKVVQMLISAGADINIKHGLVSSALYRASQHGHSKIVKMLLDCGADVDALNKHNETALLAASAMGHKEIVQMLVGAGADLNRLRRLGRVEMSALFVASEKGFDEVVQILVDAGANVNDTSTFKTALHRASSRGFHRIVKILVNAGADVNARQGPSNSTALWDASYYGYEDVVQLLVGAGADVNATNGYVNETALQVASREGHSRIVQILVDAGAELNASGSAYGRSALQEASIRGNKKVVQILVKAGAELNTTTTRCNKTALNLASDKGYGRIVLTLVNAGAIVDDKTAAQAFELRDEYRDALLLARVRQSPGIKKH